MERGVPRHQKYLFVCENARAEGACCMPEGEALREKLKEAVKDRKLSSRVRVSRAGCLDLCADGPNVLLMPDNRWFSKVSVDDVDRIVEEIRRGLE